MMAETDVTNCNPLAVTQDTIDSLLEELTALQAVIDPLEELRSGESSIVVLYNDNDCGSRIRVHGPWVHSYDCLSFTGDTLAEALATAVQAKRAAEQQKGVSQ